MRFFHRFLSLAIVLAIAAHAGLARGQGYGSDLQNVMGPASGGMAGVSVARPQDVPSAIFGNPATLAQFEGTQFTLGGGWIEGYPTVTNDGSSIARGTPFSATSRTQGCWPPRSAWPRTCGPSDWPAPWASAWPASAAAGPNTAARCRETSYQQRKRRIPGAGHQPGGWLPGHRSAFRGGHHDARHRVRATGIRRPDRQFRHGQRLRPAGNRWRRLRVERLQHGGLLLPVEDVLRFSRCRSRGIELPDVHIAQPTTFGLGIANRSLMDGNLLIAADVYYKLWEDAALWQDMMVNQWAVAVGAQLTRGNMKYRVGYSFNSNPINHSVGNNFDGIPAASDAIQLYQASSRPSSIRIASPAALDGKISCYRGSMSILCRRIAPGERQLRLTARHHWQCTTSAWAYVALRCLQAPKRCRETVRIELSLRPPTTAAPTGSARALFS